MAVPMEQRLFADRRERQDAAELSRYEFLEYQCAGSKHSGIFAPDQGRNLVAEPDDAARLEPDHRYATRHEWRKGFDAALGFTSRLGDFADRQKRAPAAQWPVASSQQMHPAAGGAQDSERGLDVFGLEIAAERVDEQHDLAAIRAPDRRTR